jgi:ATP-binding cassette subfamily F protein 3
MHSCDLLIDALNKYQGSLILVSHDRYFISKTANKIWEIVDHRIKEFKGGYEEWVAWNERMAKSEVRNQKSEKSNESNKSKGSNQANKSPKSEVRNTKAATVNDTSDARGQTSDIRHQTSSPINKDVKKELQKQQKLFQQLEEKIAELNKQKIELEASLIDPAVYSDKTKFLQAESAYKKAEAELQQLNTQYEIVFEKIMQLEGR